MCSISFNPQVASANLFYPTRGFCKIPDYAVLQARFFWPALAPLLEPNREQSSSHVSRQENGQLPGKLLFYFEE
jgi:hypothetical protein